MFKINIQSGGKKISYKPLSISLRYIIESKNLKADLKNLEKIFNVELSQLQRKSFLSKDSNKITVAKAEGKPDELLIYKIKTEENFSVDFFRNQLAGLIPSLKNKTVNSLHIFIPKYSLLKKFFSDEEYYYQSFVEGIYLGNYSFDKYKKDKTTAKDLSIFFYADDQKKLKSAVAKAKIVMDGLYFTRNLQNEPANALTPDIFANKIKQRLSKAKVRVTIYDEKAIRKRKMGGLLAIGQGSENPPRFVVLEYKPAAKTAKKKQKSKNICLVGKGVTFDSGGISIKPASNMGEMKADMSGAAVVAGTILAAAEAKLNVNLTGVIASCENMLSGNSIRPGDVVKTASGKTIEIDNTDAEGRVILADALDYASKRKPDNIIDLATLTGSCVVALGEFVAGLFTKNDKLAKELYDNGLKTYDRVWRLPIWDDYSNQIKSKIADVKNIGSSRWGDAINAAKFLEHFVDKNIPWVHLDIAGPAMANGFNNYTKDYMTGFGVRLLFEYLKSNS